MSSFNVAQILPSLDSGGVERGTIEVANYLSELKLKNNIGWEFICSESKINIEDGIYLGENETVQPNQHIIIKNSLQPEHKVKWLFRLIK